MPQLSLFPTDTLDSTDKIAGVTSGGAVKLFPASSFLFKNGSGQVAGGSPFVAYDGGTVSSGTFTPAVANGYYQYYTNNGAHTLAAPADDSAMDILVTNGASAGAISFSGFTVGASTGDSFTNTNGHKFIISVRRINSIATYAVTALQ